MEGARTGGVETTIDRLLGGRVALEQPRRGYRAGADAVLLAASCPARPGERVLDIGAGVGAVALCLAARIKGLEALALELRPELAALATANAVANGVALAVHVGDVARPPRELLERSFDHVLMNPPFFAATGSASPEALRDLARREREGGLELWVEAALRRLRQGGRLGAVLPAALLPRFLAALGGRAGDVTALPVVSREGREARAVIVGARKDRAGPARVLWPLVLHAGARHVADTEDLTPAAAAVLRDGAPLSM